MTQAERIQIITAGTTDNLLIENKYNCVFILFYNEKKQPRFIMFKGRSTRPYVNYNFKNEKQFTECVDQYEKQAKERYERKEAIKAATCQTNFPIGSFHYETQGYEQTYVVFYQVVGHKGKKSVVLQKVEQNKIYKGNMSGETSPIKDKFIGKPFTKRLSPHETAWHGKPVIYTSYH